MLESLRAELGDVAPWVRAFPRPRLPATGPVVAAARAIGAFWLTQSLLGAVTLIFFFVPPPLLQVDEVTYRPLPVRETVAALAMLVGAAVARASGGWRAVAIASAVFAATEVGGFLLWSARCVSAALPPELCPTPERTLEAAMPRVLGGALGLLAAPIVRTSRGRSPALLLAAAVLPLSSLVGQIAITPFLPVRAFDGTVTSAFVGSQLVLYGSHLAVWIAVGVVLGRLGGGPIALVILALTVVPAAAFGLNQVVVMPTPEEFRILQLVGLATNVAMVAGLIGGWRLARLRSASAERDVQRLT